MTDSQSQPESFTPSPAAPRNLTGGGVPRQMPLLPAMAIVKTPYFHVLGYSVAGEESVVQLPELNLVFDIGKCPRPVLSSDFCLLTHGHIDHSAGIVYYLSQRFFQGMVPGTVLCPAGIAEGLAGIFRAWAALEGKVPEHRLIPLNVGDEFEIRKGLVVRAFATRHSVPSVGYLILDRREKLRPDLSALNLPGHVLRDMRQRGEKITYTLDVPLAAYTGDTNMAQTLTQDGVREARVLITECTFFEPGHRRRAEAGRHLHLDDLIEALPQLRNELVLITHVSRRTYLRWAAKVLAQAMPKTGNFPRVEFLMEHAQKLSVRPGKAATFTPPEPPETIDAD
jgi:ribonuclease Z